VLIDRDPGAYMVTGRWMATHHNLVLHARFGAFRRFGAIWYDSPAIYPGKGHLTFQFSHLLPALLAQVR
jgi:hypothetical protein